MTTTFTKRCIKCGEEKAPHLFAMAYFLRVTEYATKYALEKTKLIGEPIDSDVCLVCSKDRLSLFDSILPEYTPTGKPFEFIHPDMILHGDTTAVMAVHMKCTTDDKDIVLTYSTNYRSNTDRAVTFTLFFSKDEFDRSLQLRESYHQERQRYCAWRSAPIIDEEEQVQKVSDLKKLASIYNVKGVSGMLREDIFVALTRKLPDLGLTKEGFGTDIPERYITEFEKRYPKFV